MNTIIPVQLPQASYEIAIAPHNLSQLGAWLSGKIADQAPIQLGQKLLLVSNPEIFAIYGELALQSLSQAGFDVATHLIPAGETHKHLGSIQALYDSALSHKLERSSTMVALGGGVVGDMTGFAAATWLRGINFVQVPTSLLAMVDAALGGKTGVNHPKGKNLIGAFYQPKLVLIDPTVLKTLPDREFSAGMAEVIKYGIIWSVELFESLENNPALARFSDVSPDLLSAILNHSCRAKADVVGKDEKEAGLRAILNYGHTVGHAVESLTGYSVVNHGEAVGIGMVAAGAIALNLGLWDAKSQGRQLALIQKAGLPTQLPPGIQIDAIIAALQSDKKVNAGKVRFVLPQAIGSVTITDAVPQEILCQSLANLATGVE
ncbi:MAG: 3-dehydroquinate synthase [Synechococcales cyanobacterium CRU_2_2]|nr:3-dehydroquinate synthase [Synechococcales cyanobacterium CRU_2_2]